VSDWKKTPELPGFLIGGFDRVLERRCHEYKGNKRKAKESWIWLGYACAIWFGVGLLLYLVGRLGR
jgi:hypothetical protein